MHVSLSLSLFPSPSRFLTLTLSLRLPLSLGAGFLPRWAVGMLCFFVGVAVSLPGLEAVEATVTALFVCYAREPSCLEMRRPAAAKMVPTPLSLSRARARRALALSRSLSLSRALVCMRVRRARVCDPSSLFCLNQSITTLPLIEQ